MTRPHVMNALNTELFEELARAFTTADRDDDVLAVVLSGDGGRAFSTGGDLGELAGRLTSDTVELPALRANPDVARPGEMPGFDEINACAKPTIAAIDGYAMGGGLELALYCDIRFATRRSQFAMPETRRHLLSGPAFVYLSRMIPLGEALHMHLTGKRLDAERAYTIGLLQGVYDDPESLDEGVEATLDEIRQNSPLAVQFLKRIVRDGRDMTIEQQWKLAEMYADVLARSEDASEGVTAFKEKRKPSWKAR